jgi:hypothetical protein
VKIQGSNIPTLRFWLVENSRGIIVAVTLVLLGIIFLAGGLVKMSNKVSGIAHAQALDANLTGNQPKLAVQLEDGSLVHVAVDSAGAIKIGNIVCLSKNTTYLGTVYFKLNANCKYT